MTVRPSANFASFVFKQVLDTFSFPCQLHFEIIVHFHCCYGLIWIPLPFKASLGRQLSSTATVRELVAFPRAAFSKLSLESSFTVCFDNYRKRCTSVVKTCVIWTTTPFSGIFLLTAPLHRYLTRES